MKWIRFVAIAALVGGSVALWAQMTSGASGEQTEAQVVARKIFYNGSYYDGNNEAVNASDDNAVDPTKSAYLGGGVAATYASVIVDVRGITGVMVDIAGVHGSITASDFEIKMGYTNTPSTWAAGPAPTVTVRSDAGTGGSDRVVLTWAKYAPVNNVCKSPVNAKWLQITMLANANTNLSAPDVHYWGLAAGDGTIAFETNKAYVDPTDEIDARNNPHGFSNRALVSDTYDYNKDSYVNATDQLIARNNPKGFPNALIYIVVP